VKGKGPKKVKSRDTKAVGNGTGAKKTKSMKADVQKSSKKKKGKVSGVAKASKVE